MTVVGIDVGGRKKGFHACVIDSERIVAGPQGLGGVAAAVEWVRAGETTAYGKIIAPAGALP
jgi:hypothetical protein